MSVTLTIQGVYNSSGIAVSVSVSPPDINEDGDGTTEFTRTYEAGTVVTITAAETYDTNKGFATWSRSGGWCTGNRTLQLTVTEDQTIIAAYLAAPPNDLFTSAETCAGLSGSTAGYTIGATGSEGDNPAFTEGKTVWYKWDGGAYQGRTVFFSTVGDPFCAEAKTSVKMYRPNANPALPPNYTTEVTYAYSQSNGVAGWNLGSIIAFTVPAESIWYYIRVDARPGGGVGKFTLTWGEWAHPYIRNCHSCLPCTELTQCYLCPTIDEEDALAILQPSIASENTSWFGSSTNYDAGTYTIVHLDGVFNSLDPDNHWVADQRGIADSPALGDYYMDVLHDDGSTTAHLGCTDPPPNNGFATEEAAEIGTKWRLVTFTHTGGKIGLLFYDNGYANNAATSAPRYGLFAGSAPHIFVGTPTVTVDAVISATWLADNRVQAVLRVRNDCPVACELTLAINSTGGATNPSAPDTFTVAANSTSNRTVEFDTDPTGNEDVTLSGTLTYQTEAIPWEVWIGVLLAVRTTIFNSPTCTSPPHAFCRTYVQNNGNIAARGVVVTVELSGGVTEIKNASCGVISNAISYGTINPTIEANSPYNIQKGASPKTLTLAVETDYATYPPPDTETIPAA